MGRFGVDQDGRDEKTESDNEQAQGMEEAIMLGVLFMAVVLGLMSVNPFLGLSLYFSGA